MGCMETYDEKLDTCPHCGYVYGTPAEEAIHMQPGTVLLKRYIIGKVLGYGGFGVTYVAWDSRLDTKVAIKEYLPSEFSTRMPGQTAVTAFNGDKKEQFHDGLEKFIDEAKRLAKFQNEPGIVKIFDSFAENDTAYIVMEYLEGETLTAKLKREKKIPEEDAIKLIEPVLDSLRVIHEEGIIHRDIAPDNIFLTTDGDVKLIDFGASRFATTSHSRSLTVIIKPGYSPEEQYRSRGDQGPHTDVFAMASVLYKMITGKTPPDAMERRAKIESQKKDILEEPHKLVKDISLASENAILNAMNVRIEDRTKDIAAFIAELNADPPVKRRYGKIKKIDLYRWPLWLKILLPTILVLLIVFGTLIATGVISPKSLFSSNVEVPDNMVVVPQVETMDMNEAVQLLQNQHINVSTAGNVESEYVAVGKVVFQNPNAGTYIYEYGTVALTISAGKGVEEATDGIATVPYVIWDMKEVAVEKIQKAGLGDPEFVEVYDDTVDAGKVIAQSLDYGAKVAEGTPITLTISLGPESFAMPNTKDMSEDEAIKLLEGYGLIVDVKRSASNEIKAGNVVTQSITAGTTTKPGENVVLTISTGPEAGETASASTSFADQTSQTGETEVPQEHATTQSDPIQISQDSTSSSQYTNPSTTQSSQPSEKQTQSTQPSQTQSTDPKETKTTKPSQTKQSGSSSSDPSQPSETKHKHNYTSKVVKEASCEEDGEKLFTCECGDTYTEPIPATGHDYDSEEIVKAGEGVSGTIRHTCKNCGDTYDEYTLSDWTSEYDVPYPRSDYEVVEERWTIWRYVQIITTIPPEEMVGWNCENSWFDGEYTLWQYQKIENITVTTLPEGIVSNRLEPGDLPREPEYTREVSNEYYDPRRYVRFVKKSK